MKNEDVVKRWIFNQVGGANNLVTDRNNLYSYNLLIGYTTKNGRKVVKDYTAKGGHFISQTTSRHVGIAKRYADEIEEV